MKIERHQMKKIIKFAPIIFLVLVFSVQSVSGQGFDPISMGMGGAYSAVARGINSVGWNPANLALPRDGWLEINIIGLNLNVANSSMTIENYERYFTDAGHNGEWNEQDIDEILALIPESGLDLSADFFANALGVAFGNYAISVQFIGQAFGLIPKAPLELMLRGNTKDSYNFSDLNGDGYSAVKISGSVSYPLKIKRYFDKFAVGANLNYYSGIGYSDVTEATGSLLTSLEYIHSDILITGRQAEGGTGYGLDIGGAGIINKKLSISMSFDNILGSINWNKNTKQYFTTFLVDSAEYKKDDFSVEPQDTSYTEDIEAFSTRMPVVLRMGAAYDIKEDRKSVV